jgi:hypothetical protein
MAKMIKCQINLAKIKKNKIKVNGVYKNYDIILVETPGGKYGDWMVKENSTKEERDAGNQDNILGNGKNIGWSSGSSSSKPDSKGSNVAPDDLPY